MIIEENEGGNAVLFVIELKRPKAVETVSGLAAGQRQAMVELLAASRTSVYPVVAVLTDLGGVWDFMHVRPDGEHLAHRDLRYGASGLAQLRRVVAELPALLPVE